MLINIKLKDILEKTLNQLSNGNIISSYKYSLLYKYSIYIYMVYI